MVVHLGGERATVTILDGDSVLGETVVTTTDEPETLYASTARRNYVGRLVDEVRRKRPETVYLAGDRELARALRGDLHFPCYRVDDEAPIDATVATRGDRDLETIDAPHVEKLSGRHTTLIGSRTGREAVLTTADHPHVKKVIPGPIDAGGAGSSTGVRAKVTRADENGNLRLLLRAGSAVQKSWIVTTAMNRELGERIASDLNEVLAEADLS